MAPPTLPHMTPAQREHVTPYLDRFREWLEENNPNVVDRHAGTTKWMKGSAREIMKSELFAEAMLGDRSMSETENDIFQFFRNWKNNKYKKELLASGRLNRNAHSSTGPSTTPSPGSPSRVDTSMKDAMRGLLLMEGDLPVKEFFFLNNPQALQKAKDAVKKELPDASNIVVVQKARKRAWGDADQSFWAKRKRDIENDVKSNRAMWPHLLREAIQQNIDRGVVGSVVVGLAYAMRTESNGLEHGILYAGYDAQKEGTLEHELPEHKEVVKIWQRHADRVLPMLSNRSAFDFERNLEGKLIIPELNIGEVKGNQIIEVVTSYLVTNWHTTYPPDNTVPSIPWAAIATSPSTYYDTERFPIPAGVLGPNSPSSSDLISVLSLYNHLLGFQKEGKYFCFRHRSEIQERLEAILKGAENDLEKDDENVGDDKVSALGSSDAPGSRPTSPDSPSPSIEPARLTDPNLTRMQSTNAATAPAAGSQPVPTNLAVPKPNSGPATISTLGHDSTGGVPLPVTSAPDPIPPTGPVASDTAQDSPLAIAKSPSEVRQVTQATPSKDPIKSSKSKSSKKGASLADRTIMGTITNVAGSDVTGSGTGGRRSVRARTQVQHRPTLVAGGLRSPKRKPGWSLPGGPVVPFSKKRIAESEPENPQTQGKRRRV
ncbi:hypothetical protein CC1G_12131 [Coprinopsis cinerea okayama7|uniref:Uncharacterized protein n=1 Tax=Coprinopsis cinerea (strain Okayama-7 / 130 / ATCC MYA-4618 / FGSC 9003) TaxID=240176 RepID=A8PAZ7_COPC7|nr:hypothetical protein CC1G_12131 [Coprinopsis cinerea okayama7\|eukprot:XP_001840077.1 hypothetical protein CC1G_12131 [Coprinopsis cinerea okayama7\